MKVDKQSMYLVGFILLIVVVLPMILGNIFGNKNDKKTYEAIQTEWDSIKPASNVSMLGFDLGISKKTDVESKVLVYKSFFSNHCSYKDDGLEHCSFDIDIPYGKSCITAIKDYEYKKNKCEQDKREVDKELERLHGYSVPMIHHCLYEPPTCVLIKKDTDGNFYDLDYIKKIVFKFNKADQLVAIKLNFKDTDNLLNFVEIIRDNYKDSFISLENSVLEKKKIIDSSDKWRIKNNNNFNITVEYNGSRAPFYEFELRFNQQGKAFSFTNKYGEFLHYLIGWSDMESYKNKEKEYYDNLRKENETKLHQQKEKLKDIISN